MHGDINGSVIEISIALKSYAALSKKIFFLKGLKVLMDCKFKSQALTKKSTSSKICNS